MLNFEVVAPVIRECRFPNTDQQVSSESLGYEAAEEKWSPRNSVLFVVSASASLWLAIALGVLVMI